MIGVGIVGLGKMGLLHFGILNALEDIKVIAVADKERTITKFASSVIKDLKVFEDFDDMIKSEKLDLVYITTPVSSHKLIAKKCIQNKIDFFVEKPLSGSFEETREILDELKKNHVKTMVGYYLRFVPTFAKVKQLLDENVLGDLLYVNSSIYLSQLFAKGTGWRFDKKTSGGGVLLDLGVHLIDLLLWYFGNPESLIGVTKSHYSKEVEDFAHATLKFKKELVCNIDVSWSVRNYRLQETTIEIHGTNGTIRVNDDYIQLSLNKSSGQFTNGNQIIYKQSFADGVTIDIAGPEYTKEDQYFIECIKSNKDSMINVRNAANVQSVVEAIYRSAEYKKELEIDYNGTS